ncbi:MAG: DUF3667 domain-containing protein [Chitinophagaceae bacterium]
MHDLLHFFTHLEKGFVYTLKQLIVSPGHMQRSFINGKRNVHQKPFSMFLICGTITAIARYWILNACIEYYHIDISPEAKFFHEYMVLTYTLLIPFYVLITYLFFYKSGYNFAESGVMILYFIPVLFLASVIFSSLKLIFPYLDTAYVEFPFFTIYFIVTLNNFYGTKPKWLIAVKGLAIMLLIYFINNLIENFAIRIIS